MLVSLATEPAKSDSENEDFAAFAMNAAVLLDGAGTPAGSESGCSHGVAWFSRQLGAELLAEVVCEVSRPLKECLQRAIEHVRGAHQNTCDLSHPGTPSATAMAIRISREAVEYLVLSDSVLLFDVAGSNPIVLTDDREALVGRKHRREMDALSAGSPEHAHAVRRYVETLRRYRNTDGGFWVAASDSSAAEHSITGQVPLEGLRSIALLSDGASRLADRFMLIDWSGLLQMLRDAGPRALITEIRSAEDADPYGERWPRGKSRDDATVMTISLTS